MHQKRRLMQKSPGSVFFGARPVRGFTPIIGLAVVMALALAAVFGSMSLANPAMAAIGQPADAELTEQEFHPQNATAMATVGEALSHDISGLIRGGGANFSSGSVVCVPDCTATSDTNPIEDGNPTVVADFSAINLTAPEASVRGVGRVRMTITIELKDGSDNQEIIVDVTVNPIVHEAPTVIKAIPDQRVVIRAASSGVTPAPAAETVSTKIDLADYIMDGRGNGVITTYTITPSTSDLTITDASLDQTASPSDGTEVELIAADTVGAQTVAVTVTTTITSPGINGVTTGPSITFFAEVVTAGAAATAATAGLPTFDASSQDPGDSANYTVKFQMGGNVNTRLADLVIEFNEDHGIPSSIRNTSVAITTNDGTGDVTVTPEDVTVDGEKILISLGDMDERDDMSDYELVQNETVTVHFRQSAGITTPTEHGEYFLVGINFGSTTSYEFDEGDPPNHPGLTENVYRKIGLSEDDGGLGDTLTATGKGYKNGTTLTVFVDKLQAVTWNDPNDSSSAMVRLPAGMVSEYDMRVDKAQGGDPMYGNIPMGDIPADDDGMATHYEMVSGVMYAMAPNRRLDLGDDVLCVAAKIDGSDVGKCDFTVTHPTFRGGVNYVNAVDGRNNYAGNPKAFTLKASIAATPDGGSPGETIVIQVVDFPPGPISKVEISRVALGCGGCGGSVDATGAGNFSITIPNNAKAGIQELRVTGMVPADGSDAVNASTNITLAGPRIQVTPQSVVANRRISLVGTGFSPGAVIANAVDELPQAVEPKMSIGGETIRGHRINDNDPVNVDNGGNWSASVDLPLAEATTAEGQRVIRVTDSRGRTGVVMVNVQPRTVTVTPDSGRVGTIAVVRGSGFPGKNDEGSSFNIEIVYDANNDNTTTVSAQTDASGRFEAQLRIPTTAAIPSSNTIKVSFEDDDDVVVTTTVAHEVPEGILSLSSTSGGPGSTITINGEGFKSHVPVSLVRIGSLDITPAPKPNTDVNGMMEFSVLIPGLDVGIQTIEVSVGQTTSSTGFTVIESGINPGDIKPVAEAVEPLGDNLVVVFHFNNDTKTWTFYSTDPDAADANTLTHMITGETYLLQVKASQEVILNRDTRNLTCVGGNCWNQVVW